MDDSQFGEDAKERLEKEIEELKRQKEIQDLQKEKEELEKTVYGGAGGSSATNTGKTEESARKTDNSKGNEEEDEEEVEEKYLSNRMTTILAALVAIFIVIVGSGIFYLRSQNKKKKENLKKEMAAISKNQNIPTVTSPQTSTAETVQQQEQKKAEQSKDEEKEETPKESNEKLVVRSPVGVKKGSYCVNPNPAESAFGTDTVDDSYAEHGYMADIAFENCVINSGGSVKHTGPVTITVSLAEEKNYDAVMNRNKWYLENGQINRISGRDSTFLYFNGWLMYKQSN